MLPVPRSRFYALRVGGSAVILIALFWVLPVGELLEAVRRVNGAILAVALAGYLGSHLIGVFKWRLMVNLAGAGLPPAQAARCYFAGLFGNLFLPSVVGGDLVRAGFAMRSARSASGVIAGSLADRLVDIVALAVLTMIGVVLVPGALESQGLRLLWIAAAVLSLLLGLAVVFLTFRPSRPFFKRIQGKVQPMLQAAISLANKPQYLLLGLLLGIGIQASLIFLTAWIGLACGLRLSFRIWLFAWPLAKLSALLPLTQGGIGVREVALGGLLAPFGAPVVLSVAVGLVWEVILIAGALIGGLVSLIVPAASDEQGAWSKEHGAGSKEVRAKG